MLSVVPTGGGGEHERPDGQVDRQVGSKTDGRTGTPAEHRAYTFRDDGIYVIRISPNRDHKRGRPRLRWRVDAYYTGHRKDTRACTTFSRKESAELCAAQLWHDYIGGVHAAPEAPPRTVGELIERFLKRATSKRGSPLSPKTTRSYKTQLSALKRIAGKDCPVLHLTTNHIEATLHEPHQRTDKPKSRATVVQYLTAMKALVSWALRKNWMAVDITEGVQFDPGSYEMRSFLQDDEVEPYVSACTPSHRIRSGFLLETGLRASEATHLRWDWIMTGIGRPTLRVPAHDPITGFRAKGRRVRPIPLSARAQGFLKEAADKWGGDGFVLHDRQQPPLTTNWCRDTHAACKEAGVTDVDTHGLRRTAGAHWISCGLDIYTVSRLLGHQSVVTTEKAYAGITDNRMAAAMDLVDSRAALPKLPVRKEGSNGEKSPESAATPVATPTGFPDDRNT